MALIALFEITLQNIVAVDKWIAVEEQTSELLWTMSVYDIHNVILHNTTYSAKIQKVILQGTVYRLRLCYHGRNASTQCTQRSAYPDRHGTCITIECYKVYTAIALRYIRALEYSINGQCRY